MLDTLLHKEKPSIICIKISNTIATIHKSNDKTLNTKQLFIREI